MTRVALYLQDAHPIRDGMGYAQHAEAAGFEAVWQAESRLVREATVPLAAFGAVTETIKLGSGVSALWTRNAALLASTFSTLDDLAPGRASLGLGAWWEPLASKVGVDRRRPLLAMREIVTVCRALLNMETVTFDGEFVHLDGVELDYVRQERVPKDVPIVIGATGMKMMELAGEIGDGFLLNYLVSPTYNQEALEHLEIGAALRLPRLVLRGVGHLHVHPCPRTGRHAAAPVARRGTGCRDRAPGPGVDRPGAASRPASRRAHRGRRARPVPHGRPAGAAPHRQRKPADRQLPRRGPLPVRPRRHDRRRGQHRGRRDRPHTRRSAPHGAVGPTLPEPGGPGRRGRPPSAAADATRDVSLHGADRCTIYASVHRDDLDGDVARMEAAVAFEHAVTAEDLAVQEAFHDRSIPLDLTTEVHTKADRMTVELRRILEVFVAEAALTAPPAAEPATSVAHPGTVDGSSSSLVRFAHSVPRSNRQFG